MSGHPYRTADRPAPRLVDEVRAVTGNGLAKRKEVIESVIRDTAKDGKRTHTTDYCPRIKEWLEGEGFDVRNIQNVYLEVRW